jgi:enoyl-CoA hydratase
VGYKFLALEDRNGVGIIRIDRPPANALNYELVEELHQIVDQVSMKESIKVLIFTSMSEFFVSGADIKMMQEHKGGDLPSFMEGFTVHLQRLYNKIEEIPKVAISAINGHAAGGGCELALACDLRFMARGKARIGLPEVKLGLLPGGGGTQRLARLLGRAKAFQMIVEGALLSANEALEIGLVNKVFNSDELFNQTFDYAKALASQATIAIGMIKKCINKGLDTNLRAGLALEIECQDRLFRSEDALEGIAAFIEKRKPSFKAK